MKTIKNLKAEEIRKSILQLAIQGKLVKQDPNDEPASELVKRIYAEKQRLIKEGKIKKDKNESFIFKGDDNCYYEKIGNNAPVKLEDLPFDIPDNWTWIRINEYVQKVTDFVASGSFASLRENVTYYKTENYALMVKTQDFQNNFTKDLTYTDEHGYSFLENSNLYGGELVLANVGSIGKVFIVPHLNRKMTLAPNSIMVRFFNEDHIGWFFNLFKSSFGLQLLLDISSATAIKKFNKTDFKKIIIPIPPLKEQFRIAEKVKSLEPLIAQYSTAEEKLSILEDEFPEKLKKSILQYAIEGKLVKQDPNDEPASVLLERIKAEKEKLIKEGKIKRDKNESYIYQGDDKNYYEKIGKNVYQLDIPFISKKATWTKLKNIAFITKLAGFEYSEYINPNLTNEGVPLFKGKNVQNSKIVYEFEGFIPLKISNQLRRSQVTRKCLLTPYVGTIGNVGIHEKEGVYHLGSNVGKIEIYNNFNLNIMEEFVFYYLKSYSGYDELTKFKKATAQESISIDAIRETIIPIYSLSEQLKIHAKITSINQLLQIKN